MGDMPDISSILDMLNKVKNSQPDDKDMSAETKSPQNFDMPDMETMMKIMKVMNAMNSGENNAEATLLSSLKPFLRDSKKEKVDQYIKLLKVSKIITNINDNGGKKE